MLLFILMHLSRNNNFEFYLYEIISDFVDRQI